jgi:flagellar P-ring protein precursor FlgI
LLRFLTCCFLCLGVCGALAEDTVRSTLVRDVASVAGVRENPVLGYGIVVGLKGTGDRQQTVFTTQTLGNIL